jgi:hypothetical protein
MLDAVDLESSVGLVVPIQDAIVGVPQAAQSGKVVGKVMEAVMDHITRVGTEPFHSVEDCSANFRGQPPKVGLG